MLFRSADSTGYDDPDCVQELFALSAPPAALARAQVFVQMATPDAPRFLDPTFSRALLAALPNNPLLAPLAEAARCLDGGLVDHHGQPVPLSAPPPSHSFVWRAGLLFRRGADGDRLCVSADPDLCRQVLTELHATPLGGHFGRDKTLALARRTVWWPGWATDVATFIRTCPVCQRVKAEHGPPPGLLYPLPVPTRRGGTIGLDFLELPTASTGHDFLQVHIDFLTGRVWLAPTFKRATAAQAAALFVRSVFRDVELPDVEVYDRDTRFTLEFWTALHAELGTTLVFGSLHHHNTNPRRSA